MGGESSKADRPSLEWYAKCREREEWTRAAVVPIDDWKHVCNPVFAIDYYSTWKNRNLRVNRRLLSGFTVTGKNVTTGKEEKLCAFNCKVQETGREEKLKGWLKDASVIALHPKVAVIQLVLPHAVKLLIVDWHSNHLLATYTFAYNKEPCFQECFLSPDASVMLCRQNFWLRRKLNHLSTFDPNIRVIQIKDGLCRRLFVIEDTLLPFGVFASGISMDPRYPSGQASIISSTLQMRSQQDNLHNLQVYDISRRQRVHSVMDSSLAQLVHHAEHSPDGRLVAVLLVHVSIYLSVTVRAHEVRVLAGDTLAPLHCLELHGVVTRPHRLTTFPAFSRDVAFLAQSGGGSVHVLRLPVHCATLQEWCRLTLRRHTRMAHVHALPLPKSIQAFLNYQTTL